MKKLFSSLVALVALFSISSCLQEERSPEEILVPSPAKVDCSDESLKLTSKVPSGSEKLVDECGFYYGKDESLADATKITGSMEVNEFAIDLPERNYGTTYYICSYVTNGHGSEIRSAISSYNLKPLKEYIEFEPVELVSYSKVARKADVAFSAEIWNGVSVSETGVCFGVTTSPSDDGRHQEGILSEEGVVTVTLSNFDVDTQYYLRAYVKDGEYTAYGEVIPLIIKLTPPTLSSVIISSVESNSALFSSSVTSNGGDLVSEVGFYYSTEETVDPETSRKINQPYSEASFDLQANELAANTKYYVKAYAVNSAGVGYSQTTDFTTSAGAPSVTTLGATDVTSAGATLSGTVIADNGAAITERGFVWMQGTGTPTTDSFKLKVDGTTGEFTSTLTGLESNQKYSFRAYAINSKGTSYGDVMTFTTGISLASLTSVTVSSITSISATLSSKVASHGGETVSEVGFYYSTDAEVDLAKSQKVNRTYSSDSFSISISELSINTKYYVKAYAVNSAGTVYSEIESFTTLASTPVVTTVGSSDVTSVSAVLSGKVVTDNGAAITERGFVWLKGSDAPTTSSNKVKVDGTTGEFTSTLDGLEPNQKYSFRAYAINSKGTSYGDVMTFTTGISLASLTSVTVSSITSTSATLSSKVSSHGGETVSEVGFYYSTDAAVDLGKSQKVNSTYSSDSFSISISELSINTKYYVKAYAVNSAGTVYSEIESFTTLASTPVVTTVGSSDVTSVSAVLSGKVLTDNGAAITERGFVWLKGSDAPTTSSNKLKVDGTTGEFTSTLDGLEPNQKFSFRAYAINSKGTAYGDVMTFSTIVGLPVLSPVGVSDVTAISATFAADVTEQGGENVTEVGFYYSTEEAVYPETSIKVKKSYTGTAFTASVSDLLIFTTYYVKAYAVNSAGVAYSDVVSFKTLASTPVVNTLPASEVSSDSAVLSGKVVTDNGAAITERGFVWLKGSDAPTTSSNKVKVEGTTGEFTSTLDGLEPNRKYSFRAYAINSKGTAYGDVMTFTTVAGLPTLSAMKVSDITTTSATFTCAVTGHGGDIVSEVGFYIGKEENVDIETALKISEAYTSDSFTLTATDLEVGTDYYVKAFTKNSVGESYSVIVSFKTVSTAPSVTTVGSSEVTDSSALLSGEVTDDNGEDITERGFVWLKGTGTPTKSNSKLRSDGTTGEYSLTLSALEPNQTYSFRSYAVNAKGTAYGETMTFMTEVALPEVVFVSCSDVTSSSAIVSGKVTSHGGETVSEVGFLYGTTSDLDSATSSKVTVTYTGDSFSLTLTSLIRATEYYVQPFAKNSAGTAYGEVTSFTALPELPVVTTNAITDITDNSAVCGGVIVDDGGSDIIAKGVVWSRSKNPIIEKSLTTNSGFGMGSFNNNLMELLPGRTYYVRAYATNVMGTAYGDERQFTTTGEIQATHLEAANSFIISSSEVYLFKTVKGNSSESVGSVSSADILWESYGTAETPEVGSLVSSVSVQDDMIVFEVTEPYREGNAVIAAKDADGTILWSWHIWLTDQPQEQVYNNNAGTMMDRNLGATSATPGDVGALGLLYQWGRKDPFLGSSSIQLGSKSFAQSTITWPSSEISDSFIGTIEYTVSHPTTFILRNNLNNDWYYSKSSAMDNTRWQSDKTIYDPCPSGWRVPSGGAYGVWSQAVGSSSDYTINSDAINMGFNFSGDFGNFSTIWYPTSGGISPVSGSLSGVGSNGYYWSVTPLGFQAYNLYLYRAGDVGPSHSNNNRASGISVRCLQESE